MQVELVDIKLIVDVKECPIAEYDIKNNYLCMILNSK